MSDNETLKLDCREKQMFEKILKEGHGGKFYQVLTQGITTNVQKHDVWKSIVCIFNDSTGRKATVKQLRTLFQRMRKNAKQKHDAAINRQYTAACSVTGGGPGPAPPPEVDGDMVEDLEYDELDPTRTDWNNLTRSGHAKRLRLENVSSPTTMLSYQEYLNQTQAANSPTSSAGRPVPNFPSARIGGSESIEQISGVQTNPVQETPSHHAALHHPSPGFAPNSSSSSPGAMVTLVHQNGISEQVPVVAQNNNNNRNQKQRKSKKDSVDAATKYYTDLLLVQKSMSLLRRRHIRSKMRTEQLKQAILKEKLESNLIPLPELVESSDSSDNEVDEVDEGDL